MSQFMHLTFLNLSIYAKLKSTIMLEYLQGEAKINSVICSPKMVRNY